MDPELQSLLYLAKLTLSLRDPEHWDLDDFTQPTTFSEPKKSKRRKSLKKDKCPLTAPGEEKEPQDINHEEVVLQDLSVHDVTEREKEPDEEKEMKQVLCSSNPCLSLGPTDNHEENVQVEVVKNGDTDLRIVSQEALEPEPFSQPQDIPKVEAVNLSQEPVVLSSSDEDKDDRYPPMDVPAVNPSPVQVVLRANEEDKDDRYPPMDDPETVQDEEEETRISLSLDGPCVDQEETNISLPPVVSQDKVITDELGNQGDRLPLNKVEASTALSQPNHDFNPSYLQPSTHTVQAGANSLFDGTVLNYKAHSDQHGAENNCSEQGSDCCGWYSEERRRAEMVHDRQLLRPYDKEIGRKGGG